MAKKLLCKIFGCAPKYASAYRYAVTYHKKFNPVIFKYYVCAHCNAVSEKKQRLIKYLFTKK